MSSAMLLSAKGAAHLPSSGAAAVPIPTAGTLPFPGSAINSSNNNKYGAAPGRVSAGAALDAIKNEALNASANEAQKRSAARRVEHVPPGDAGKPFPMGDRAAAAKACARVNTTNNNQSTRDAPRRASNKRPRRRSKAARSDSSPAASVGFCSGAVWPVNATGGSAPATRELGASSMPATGPRALVVFGASFDQSRSSGTAAGAGAAARLASWHKSQSGSFTGAESILNGSGAVGSHNWLDAPAVAAAAAAATAGGGSASAAGGLEKPPKRQCRRARSGQPARRPRRTPWGRQLLRDAAPSHLASGAPHHRRAFINTNSASRPGSGTGEAGHANARSTAAPRGRDAPGWISNGMGATNADLRDAGSDLGRQLDSLFRSSLDSCVTMDGQRSSMSQLQQQQQPQQQRMPSTSQLWPAGPQRFDTQQASQSARGMASRGLKHSSCSSALPLSFTEKAQAGIVNEWSRMTLALKWLNKLPVPEAPKLDGVELQQYSAEVERLLQSAENDCRQFNEIKDEIVAMRTSCAILRTQRTSRPLAVGPDNDDLHRLMRHFASSPEPVVTAPASIHTSKRHRSGTLDPSPQPPYAMMGSGDVHMKEQRSSTQQDGHHSGHGEESCRPSATAPLRTSSVLVTLPASSAQPGSGSNNGASGAKSRQVHSRGGQDAGAWLPSWRSGPEDQKASEGGEHTHAGLPSATAVRAAALPPVHPRAQAGMQAHDDAKPYNGATRTALKEAANLTHNALSSGPGYHQVGQRGASQGQAPARPVKRQRAPGGSGGGREVAAQQNQQEQLLGRGGSDPGQRSACGTWVGASVFAERLRASGQDRSGSAGLQPAGVDSVSNHYASQRVHAKPATLSGSRDTDPSVESNGAMTQLDNGPMPRQSSTGAGKAVPLAPAAPGSRAPAAHVGPGTNGSAGAPMPLLEQLQQMQSQGPVLTPGVEVTTGVVDHQLSMRPLAAPALAAAGVAALAGGGGGSSDAADASAALRFRCFEDFLNWDPVEGECAENDAGGDAFAAEAAAAAPIAKDGAKNLTAVAAARVKGGLDMSTRLSSGSEATTQAYLRNLTPRDDSAKVLAGPGGGPDAAGGLKTLYTGPGGLDALYSGVGGTGSASLRVAPVTSGATGAGADGAALAAARVQQQMSSLAGAGSQQVVALDALQERSCHARRRVASLNAFLESSRIKAIV